MIRLLSKYADKLVKAGLSEPNAPLLAGLDDTMVFNRQAPEAEVLAGVFERMSINALAYAPLAEPYRTMVDFLAGRADGSITPSDCETRTFQHDLPVVREFSAQALAQALRRRKCVIVPGQGVVAHGTVSPEQAFVSISSVCFACFVKFFGDYLSAKRLGNLDKEYLAVFERVKGLLPPVRDDLPDLMVGPFATPDQVLAAMVQAGQATVDYHLVDSFFGNLSYCLDETIYISQTGSSLDELEDCIDPCPLDGSTCAGLTASSELVAHREVVLRNPARAILHGHPRFAVILSMDCPKTDCPNLGRCHVDCQEERHVWDIPIVPGEVGNGPKGVATTLPPAMTGHRGVIVHGHGIFALGSEDYREAFRTLLEVENYCREEYFRRAAALTS